MEIDLRVVNIYYATICFVGFLGQIWMWKLINQNKHLGIFTKILLANLFVADSLVLLLIPLVVAHSIINYEWVFGIALCKIYFSVEAIGKFGSFVSIALLGFDRYLGVCHPFTSMSIRKKNVAIALIAAGWLLVIAFMIPVAYTATVSTIVDENNNISYHCGIVIEDNSSHTKHVFLFTVFVILFVLPLLFVWGCYISVVINLMKSKQRSRRNSTKSPSLNQSATLDRKRTIWRHIIVFSIVIGYTVFWLPYWIIQFGTEFFFDFTHYENFHVLTIVSLIAYSGQYLSSAMNPFIYGIGLKLCRERNQNRKKTATTIRKGQNHLPLVERSSGYSSFSRTTSL